MATSFTPAPAGNKSGKKSLSRAEDLQQRVAGLADAGPLAIGARLQELDREWTAGRATKATIGILIVVGFGLTALLNPWWLILPAIGGVFLLQYLFTRSSWIGKMFQEMGFRSGFDVDQEKMALKVIRGDFKNLPTLLDIENKEDISRLEGEGGIVLEPDEAKVAPSEAAKVALEATKN
jgi:hypothetical protein